MIEKSIFISHSSKNEDIALDIGLAIENKLGKESIWIDYFDLSGSDELVPVISNAIGKAKWFVLIASKESMASAWVLHEAKLALFRSIEKKDFRVLTIKVDDCQFPPEIDLELRSRKYIDASVNSKEAIDSVAELIYSQTNTRSIQKNVFVDRGSEVDEIEQAYNKAKVIYVVGWHGMGKTSVVEEFANTRLGAPYIKIDITPGHDSELLCRQIIARANYIQPKNGVDKITLYDAAFDALKGKFSDNNGFLFLDDAEKAMDDTGQFREYLKDFVDFYYSTNIFDNPIILSTIQQPELTISQAKKSSIVVIRPLPNTFTIQCIERWYYAIKNEKIDTSLDSVADTIGGHPLSAYLLASYLAFQTPEILNRKRFIASFRKNSAEYILRSYLAHFDAIDFLLLQIISVVSSGINVSDLSRLPIVRKAAGNLDVLDKVKESLSKLAQRLLLLQDGEMLLLHPFISQFFLEKSKEDNNYIQIAKEVANASYNKTSEILEKLKLFDKDPDKADNRVYRQLNYQLMDHLAPAHRLLLISGQNEKALNLPFTFRGHFREMVFVSYQSTRDYSAVIAFADQWLLVEPNDLEVLTYKARALRRLGQTKEAHELLIRLSKHPQDRIQSKVSRELGFIARDNDDLETAIYHFEHAAHFKNRSGNPLYPPAQADLASALIDRAKLRGTKDASRVAEFKRAINLYDEVQRFLSDFDSYHLPLYVDALMNVDREKEALELLEDAILLKPDDPRLNLRMADVLRKDHTKLDEAYIHAKKAEKGNPFAAQTVMAMIRLDQDRFEDVLELVKSFNSQTKRELILTTLPSLTALYQTRIIRKTTTATPMCEIIRLNIPIRQGIAAKIVMEVMMMIIPGAIAAINYLSLRKYKGKTDCVICAI